MDKVLRLSHPKFHAKNLNFVIKIFLDNDYPIEFIFDTIRTRVKTLTHKKLITQPTPKLMMAKIKSNNHIVYHIVYTKGVGTN